MANKELPTSYTGENKEKPPFSNLKLALMSPEEANELYDGGQLLIEVDKTPNRNIEIGGRGD